MNRPLYGLAALAASFALVAGACGGDDGSDADTAGTASTATAAAEATTATTTTSEATLVPSTPGAEATSEATPAESGESTTLEEVFDSYRHSLNMEMSVDGLGSMFSIATEGAFVAPDRRSSLTTSGAAGFNTTLETISIGDTTWVRQGTGAWTEYTADTVPPEFGLDATGASDLALDAETRSRIEDLDGTPETVNGRETTRYELDEDFYQSMADVMGETFNVSDFEEFASTVWIDNETDQAIKMDFRIVALPSAFGSDLEGLPVPPDARITMTMVFELSQINDSSISVEPPTS